MRGWTGRSPESRNPKNNPLHGIRSQSLPSGRSKDRKGRWSVRVADKFFRGMMTLCAIMAFLRAYAKSPDPVDTISLVVGAGVLLAIWTNRGEVA